MENKKKSWLDPLTEEHIVKYLNNRYTRKIYGTTINNLESYDFKFIYENGKKSKVKFDLKIQDDYDTLHQEPIYDEFGDIGINIESAFFETSWNEMIKELNKGRTINGRTYDEARLLNIKKQITRYYKVEQKKLKDQKLVKLQKLTKKRKELKQVELGEEE